MKPGRTDRINVTLRPSPPYLAQAQQQRYVQAAQPTQDVLVVSSGGITRKWSHLRLGNLTVWGGPQDPVSLPVPLGRLRLASLTIQGRGQRSAALCSFNQHRTVHSVSVYNGEERGF